MQSDGSYTLNILDLKHAKTKPDPNLIVNNVKKVLVRLASKNLRIPLLLEFKNRASTNFSHPLRLPENP